MGRKWINRLNVRFPRVGGDKTPSPLIGQARIKWCRHHVIFSFVQHNKSPLLLKAFIATPAFISLSSNNQTNKWLDTNHTGAVPRQGLLMCRFYNANIRCLLQKYVCTSDLQPNYPFSLFLWRTVHFI